MKVFISWSGDRSRQVAEALGDWLKKVVQSVEPLVSTDMERGVRWLAEVNKSLDEHSFGILSVTPENVAAPWLNYEAGALAKHLGEQGRVIPYLLGFHSPSDLREPLAQFNASLADQDGTWLIVSTLNKHAEFNLNESALAETFDVWWPKLRDRLTEIASESLQLPARRDTDDKIDELLKLTREVARHTEIVETAFGQSDFMWQYHLSHEKQVSDFKLKLWPLLIASGWPAESREKVSVYMQRSGDFQVFFPVDSAPEKIERLRSELEAAHSLTFEGIIVPF